MADYMKVKKEYVEKYGPMPPEFSTYSKDKLILILTDCLKQNKDIYDLGYYDRDHIYYHEVFYEKRKRVQRNRTIST